MARTSSRSFLIQLGAFSLSKSLTLSILPLTAQRVCCFHHSRQGEDWKLSRGGSSRAKEIILLSIHIKHLIAFALEEWKDKSGASYILLAHYVVSMLLNICSIQTKWLATRLLLTQPYYQRRLSIGVSFPLALQLRCPDAVCRTQARSSV